MVDPPFVLNFLKFCLSQLDSLISVSCQHDISNFQLLYEQERLRQLCFAYLLSIKHEDESDNDFGFKHTRFYSINVKY